MISLLIAVILLLVAPSSSYFKGRSSTTSIFKRGTATPFYSTKKASAAPSTKGQIRVRFLQDVPKQGKKGEVVFVSSALFTNVLLPAKSVVRISDEDWEKEQVDKAAKDKAEVLHLTEMSQKINALPPVLIKKKIGEAGKIFGSISRKALLETLRSSLPDEESSSLAKMAVLAIHAGTEGGATVEDDVRLAGAYVANLNLGNPGVAPALFKFEIVSEK